MTPCRRQEPFCEGQTFIFSISGRTREEKKRHGGDQELLQRLRQAMKLDPREQPAAHGLTERPGMGEVIAAMEKIKGEKWEVFRDRNGDWGRDAVLYCARKACGLSLKELGEATGQMDYAAVSAAIKRPGAGPHHEPAPRGGPSADGTNLER